MEPPELVQDTRDRVSSEAACLSDAQCAPSDTDLCTWRCPKAALCIVLQHFWNLHSAAAQCHRGQHQVQGITKGSMGLAVAKFFSSRVPADGHVESMAEVTPITVGKASYSA